MKETYSAFTTTMGSDDPRVPISGERIVIDLGTDDQTGLPLELSICLEKNPDNSLTMWVKDEWRKTAAAKAIPRILFEDVLAINVKRVRVAYATLSAKSR